MTQDKATHRSVGGALPLCGPAVPRAAAGAGGALRHLARERGRLFALQQVPQQLVARVALGRGPGGLWGRVPRTGRAGPRLLGRWLPNRLLCCWPVWAWVLCWLGRPRLRISGLGLQVRSGLGQVATGPWGFRLRDWLARCRTAGRGPSWPPQVGFHLRGRLARCVPRGGGGGLRDARGLWGGDV